MIKRISRLNIFCKLKLDFNPFLLPKQIQDAYMTTALDSSFLEFWIWINHNSLPCIATNQFASICIDISSHECYFRVCQSGEILNKKAFFLYILIFYHVAVCLFSNRSQRMSKCGKNISDTLSCASCVTFLFLPHFDVIIAWQDGIYLLNK